MPELTPDRPPLWLVMQDATAKLRNACYPFAASDRVVATEIRAVRDWIEQWQIENYSVVLPDVREVLDWLTAEALRAERGDE